MTLPISPSFAKSNDNHMTETIILPIPVADLLNVWGQKQEMDIYVRFMRALREVPTSRMEIKILSAIHSVADMTDQSDAEIAKILVDMGLRVPRISLPTQFLDYVDQALMRNEWEIGSAGASLKSLQDHWSRIGEDQFAAFRKFHPTLCEGLFVKV